MSDVFGKYKDIQRRIPDLSKAKNILGYSPKYKLSDAIKITIDTITNDKK
jgi:nucleoside-diphosphate-sugar epimerase